MHIDWGSFDAVLFDLDGVLTPTALVHRRAWKRTFDRFLLEYSDDPRPFTDSDYLTHVDGKPRYDGVRDFLAARGIELDDGSPDDPPGWGTVCAIGNAKNDSFNRVLADDGVRPFPSSVRLLDHLRDLAVQVAVVSSSANARRVLDAAGLSDRFEVVVDGATARSLGLAGKPAPDTFLEAARRLEKPIERTAVIEDAISGVAAGRRGGFALVLGVAREGDADELFEAGADDVVGDLAETLDAEAAGEHVPGDE